MKTSAQKLRSMAKDAQLSGFILEAVRHYSNEVLSDSTDWGNNSLINKDYWQMLARLAMEETKV
jgi:hypothetical protein